MDCQSITEELPAFKPNTTSNIDRSLDLVCESENVAFGADVKLEEYIGDMLECLGSDDLLEQLPSC